MNTYIHIFTIGLLVLVITSCNTDERERRLQAKLDDSANSSAKLLDDFNKAKQVFYSLPSPIETAMLIKRTGAKYNESILNPLTNNVNYNTNKSKALNFGIYGADLSYASLFDQAQTSVKYLSVSKSLAEQLGIMELMQRSVVERLEKNINNRDSCMEIITETFMNSNNYFRENGRPEIAALTIAGGWIEGLYIAIQLTKTTPNNKELIDRIIDQRLSLNTLLNLLNDYNNNVDIKQVIDDFQQIKAIYDKIQVVTSKVQVATDNTKQITSLNAKTEIFIDETVFKELTAKVEEIRLKFIS